jgi:GNAT superfamily N-acetyltransferase
MLRWLLWGLLTLLAVAFSFPLRRGVLSSKMSSFKEYDDMDEVEQIRQANAIMNIQEKLPDVLPLEYRKGGSDEDATTFSLHYCSTVALNPKQTLQIFRIFETNMKEHYEATWGWNRNDKMKELFHPASRFIVASSAPATGIDQVDAATIVGFTIYRFDWDDEDEPEHPVVFCYELQVDASHRGYGLGRLFTSLIVAIADKLKMWKVMLTCFKRNTAAMDFYKHAGFGIDSNSPSLFGSVAEEDFDYEILSNRPALK